MHHISRWTAGLMFAALLSLGEPSRALAADRPPDGLACQGLPKFTQANAAGASDANSSKSQAVEKLALRILATEPVKKAEADGFKIYEASQVSAKPDAMRYAKFALHEAATFASLNAAARAAPEPSFIWLYAAPRKWNGYSLPGTRWYGDNADTLYRVLHVDDKSTYEISICPAKTLPAQLSLMVYDWVMHNGLNPRNDVPLGTFTVTEDTPRNADGSITLTVGPEPALNRPNHIQLKPGAMQVLVREIRGDWTQPVVRLAARRTTGPAPAAKTLEELSGEAADLARAGATATVNISVGFGSLAENSLGPIRVRWVEETGTAAQKLAVDEPLGPDQALGFLSSFLFNLKEDEAMVLTLNTMGTKYLNVNSYRPWLVTPDHVHRTSSMNNYQAKANPDGSLTFVIARKDPGVYNWIDVGGIPYGEAAVRWQSLTTPVIGNMKNAVQSQKVVKLADLRSELPPSTVWVTAAERSAQRALRAKQFKLRCLGTPCEVGGELESKY